MEFKCGYRGYVIIRKGDDAFWQIYTQGGLLACPSKFYNFGDARREVDWLRCN